MNRLWAEIDFNALKNNVEISAQTVGNGVGIIAVVKADAYGHGAVEVCRTLEGAAQVEMFGVSCVDEGLELRDSGISGSILVLGVTPPDMMSTAVEAGLTLSVFTHTCLDALSATAANRGGQTSYHMKVDTGMGRLGADEEDVLALVEKASSLDNLRFEGLFTHLADSSGPAECTSRQINRFNYVISVLTDAGMSPPVKHIANSAAVQRFPASFGDMVRPGIMLYGSSFDSSGLLPVMKIKTSIIRIRKMEAGRQVGYGGTYMTRKPSILATLPVGYKDGYFRSLSDCGRVSVGGTAVPVVGKVCMDFTTVDITGVEGVRVGDEVILFGDENVSVEDVAGWARTIPYEVMTALGGGARKKVFKPS